MSIPDFKILGHKAKWKIDCGNFRYYHPVKLTPDIELYVINKIVDDNGVIGPFGAQFYVPSLEYQKGFDEKTIHLLEVEILEFSAYFRNKMETISDGITSNIILNT